jgi:hypothetical protein
MSEDHTLPGDALVPPEFRGAHHDEHHEQQRTRYGGADAVTAARPVVLLRARSGTAPETARVVHLAPLTPGGTGAVTALCGALLRPEEFQTVAPGYGMPCDLCTVSHLTSSHPPVPAPDGAASATTTATTTAPDPTSPAITPRTAVLGYRAWGWPVSLRRDQIWLSVGGDTVALLMPSLLAAEVTAILARRRCPPPVLSHPYAPDHRVLLCGERFGVALPWPPGVHQVTGTLLVPPSTTPRGPLSWVHPPGPDTLRGCREIDIVAAVRAALRDRPSASEPMHF